jgi:hypothetical protein
MAVKTKWQLYVLKSVGYRTNITSFIKNMSVIAILAMRHSRSQAISWRDAAIPAP